MLRHLFIIASFIIFAGLCRAQNISITPANWWTGMHNNTLTLVVENAPPGISNITVSNSTIKVIKHYPAANPVFYFIEIEVPNDARPHTATFNIITNRPDPLKYPFEIKERLNRPANGQLQASDAIYQLIPDRFCNGNEENDNIASYFEKKDRLNPTGIHGGDLKGILSKLDYIKDLGCTALEILPVTESNLMMNSYKRLAPTHYYKVDKHLGDINLYKQLIDSCQSSELKFIQTFNLHQVGNKHPYFQHMIDAEFFNGQTYDFNATLPDYSLLTDPYGPESLKKKNRQVWSKPNFPTLNQDNQLVRQIVIQHVLWWTETTGLKNLKIDHAARNTPAFIRELYSCLSREYDDLTIIIDNESYNNQNLYWEELTIDLPTFLVNYNYPKALSNAFSPFEPAEKGTEALYRHYLQIEPAKLKANINMLDNPVLNRAFTNADSDETQLMMMVGHLICSPGLPSIYYGTEWEIKGMQSKGMSNLAKDFPGGWNNDETNGFSARGMSDEQIHFYQQLTQLLQWRKENPEVFNGDFIHLVPQNDVYAFARKSTDKTILVVINNSTDNIYNLAVADFTDIIAPFSKCTELLSNEIYLQFKDVIVRNKSIAILILEK